MNYWHVKAASLERTLRMQQLQDEAAKLDATFKAVMDENGLDATKNYTLKDADESATEVATDGA